MSEERTGSGSSPRAYYDDRINACAAEVNLLTARKMKVSRARIGVLAVWLILLVLVLNAYISPALAVFLAIMAFVGLLVLAAADERLAEAIRLANERKEVSLIQVARMDRTWNGVPECQVDVPTSLRHESHDLDIFGHASLYHLICRTHTPRGIGLLRDWLADGASPEVVRDRNAAAAALAPMRDYREQLDLCGRVLATSGAGPEAFVEWAEGPRWLESRQWISWCSRVLVAAWVIAVLLMVVGVVSNTVGLVICLSILAVNLLLSVLLVGNVHDIFNMVDSRQRDVAQYQELLGLFEKLPTDAPLLKELRKRMGEDTARPQVALSQLTRIMAVAQMRHSGLFGVFHLLLQLAFMLDFHVLHVLENWHRTWGDAVRGWFDAVGELEALASLGSVVHDNPDWVFPDYDVKHSHLKAEQIGHPLIPSPVCNDVQLGPAGSFLLVTGSNMSGKSTLLRSIGTNVVLAQAGAPVAATEMQLGPLQIATSMRIQDSLEDGVSFFMAELQRLKEIVDRAATMKGQGDRTMLFLLDEILQGTNSAERHTAVTRVVRRLTEDGAMGAISTHDLELAACEQLLDRCVNVHFRETITADDEMTFDYEMRSGVATSTNALKLLELVGIAD